VSAGASEAPSVARGPDFIIAGAPRSGTTWLYRNLAANPRIFMPANKEPRYYALEEGMRLAFAGPGDDGWMNHFVRARGEYERLFAGAEEGQIRGEASSDYLFRSATAARRIREEAPEARIVILLRDPVRRAYSNWLHHMRDGREKLPFRAALNAEAERARDGWAWWWLYAERGLYAVQLEPFLSRFPAEQLLVLTYDELQADPVSLLHRVCAFLGVDPAVGSEVGERRNESRFPRSRAHRTMRRVVRPNSVSRAVMPQTLRTRMRLRVDRATLHKPEIRPEDYRRLRRRYAGEIARLRGMVDVDVSAWSA
jgi:ribosomal protein L28